MSRRNILIVHQNFPGQFPHIATALMKRGDRVAAIGGSTAKGVPGIDLRRWENKRGSTPNIFPRAVRAEADLIRAEAAARAALALQKDGFIPDLIMGHPGWGETLHMKEIFPDARLVLLGEYFYRSQGGDTDFDPEFGLPDVGGRLHLNALNAAQSLAYVLADQIVCPTPYQASTFPPILRDRIMILHEGIDTTRARRRAAARLKLPNGRMLDGSRPVVTYISRTLEPLRGFHIFMRALPSLMAAQPEADVVVVGRDAAQGYGHAAPAGTTWKSHLLAEVGERIDAARLHFLGPIEHGQMIDLLSLSWAHAYLTYPFVLSWSLLEAMACECAIVASDTPPVRDAIRHGWEGLSVDFFDAEGLAAALSHMIDNRDALASQRRAARETVLARFDRETVGVPGWLALIDEVMAR